MIGFLEMSEQTSSHFPSRLFLKKRTLSLTRFINLAILKILIILSIRWELFLPTRSWRTLPTVASSADASLALALRCSFCLVLRTAEPDLSGYDQNLKDTQKKHVQNIIISGDLDKKFWMIFGFFSADRIRIKKRRWVKNILFWTNIHHWTNGVKWSTLPSVLLWR